MEMCSNSAVEKLDCSSIARVTSLHHPSLDPMQRRPVFVLGLVFRRKDKRYSCPVHASVLTGLLVVFHTFVPVNAYQFHQIWILTHFQEKRRKKNFMMMRYNKAVRSKSKRSFREKQVCFPECSPPWFDTHNWNALRLLGVCRHPRHQ